MIEQIKKTREYLDYLEEHYNNVQEAWKLIKEKCKDMNFIYDDFKYWSLEESIKNHDESKLSVEEFVPYRKFFHPINKEEKDKKAFDAAWENHKKMNRHHWENWTQIDKREKDKKGIISTVELDVVENVVDWVAMSIKFGGTAQEFYEKNKKEIKIPEWAEKFMYAIFSRIYKEENKNG